MNDRCCQDCLYWDENKGSCHRFPPAHKHGDDWQFPKTSTQWWCGEFKDYDGDIGNPRHMDGVNL